MSTVQLTPEELLGPLNEVEKKNSPIELFIEGHRDLLLSGARVSVVGSRKVPAEGRKRTKALAVELCRRDVVVVSGLAEGVDTVAHEMAIEVGGRTIAVLGTPLDKCYPAKNRDLFERIKKDHLAVSQFPAGYPSRPQNFPIRNRTMALISDATVIVEAGQKSGTLHQGWEALRLGRPLFLLESLTKNGALSWVQEMIGYGAQVLSREGLETLFDQLPQRSSGEASRVAL